MCGICGIVNYSGEPVNPRILQKMNDVLYRRGPDDEGFLYDGPVGLGMRRLSIIDVNGGHQPVYNEDKTIGVVLNGEIYNFQKLAEQLKKNGHKFSSNTDTEVIVHLYEEYGERFVSKLRGMFAIALWDSQENKLILARDRIGIKPLFYYENANSLLFSSEIKSLLQHPEVSRTLDLVSIDQFLTMLYVPYPRTIYKNMYKFPPAHFLVVQNGIKHWEQYWTLSYQPDRKKSLQDFSAEILDKFRETVRMHMISDVPLGTLLSGGVDSSALVAVMSEYSKKPVETFTISYENEKVFDETEYARMVAEKFSSNHHELKVQPDLLNEIREICGYFDEPFADSSMIPNFYVSRMTRKYVTVALCGLGGDEMAAGYNRYAALLFSRYYHKIPRLLREKWAIKLVNRLPDSRQGSRFNERLKRFVRAGALSLDERYLNYTSFLDRREKNSLYMPDFYNAVNGELEQQFSSYFNSDSTASILDRALFTDLKMYLPDDLLTLSDRMSMYHSLELRVPFLDHEFVELMATVPPEYKLHGLSKKYILKKTFEHLLPREILYRPKKGFSIPLVLWFRNELKQFTEETLSKKNIDSLGLFNYGRISDILNAHMESRENYHSQIWALLNFMLWYEANYPA